MLVNDTEVFLDKLCNIWDLLQNNMGNNWEPNCSYLVMNKKDHYHVYKLGHSIARCTDENKML